MQANSNPGQFLMSYSNGFAESSPKLASKENASGVIVTAGKSRIKTRALANWNKI
jgi:hypothetical protein